MNEKQKGFCKQYLIDLNATQAAIRAGYSARNSDKIGSQLLGKTRVAAEIQRLMTLRGKRLDITADRVLQEIAKLSFSNLQDFYRPNGSLKDVTELDRDTAAALHSTKTNFTDDCAVIEVKLHDKLKGLELLGRHLQLFKDGQKDDDEVPTPTRVEIVVKDARK